jgi:hypothetical protein
MADKWSHFMPWETVEDELKHCSSILESGAVTKTICLEIVGSDDWPTFGCTPFGQAYRMTAFFVS